MLLRYRFILCKSLSQWNNEVIPKNIFFSKPRLCFKRNLTLENKIYIFFREFDYRICWSILSLKCFNSVLSFELLQKHRKLGYLKLQFIHWLLSFNRIWQSMISNNNKYTTSVYDRLTLPSRIETNYVIIFLLQTV